MGTVSQNRLQWYLVSSSVYAKGMPIALKIYSKLHGPDPYTLQVQLRKSLWPISLPERV